MKPSKGIQTHKLFKLGKAPAKRDKRNFKLAALLTKLPPIPAVYDFDVTYPGIPTPMFANDVHGDCVIAGRAHQTLRFEDIEQGALISITDRDVLKEYFKESGGADSGLIVLDSLNAWRKTGWKAAGKNYSIAAFAEIDHHDHNDVKAAIYLLTGAGVGLSLPKSARQQMQTGQPWNVVSGPTGQRNTWGGHYVYLCGYNKAGPVCVTWGRKQQMTWAFFDAYADEAYGIVDNVDKWRKKSGINVAQLQTYLNSL